MAEMENNHDLEAFREARGKAIEEFCNQFAVCEDQRLLEDMLVTVSRLARDGTNRGELKLLANSFKELRYAFKVFAPYRHIRKVSMFGSSRTPVEHPEYKQADEFARRMRELKWMVITGAGDGIMRAGHYGAGAKASFGVAIRLPFEQQTNTIIADDPKLINFRYFFTRKLLFMKEASAIALFPGGFGTQDEGFEALTLIQTGKAELVPVVLVDSPGGNYWQRWKSFVESELLDKGMISPEDMELFKITDDAGEAVRYVTEFYRRFHSARYVGPQLVIRLESPLSAEAVEGLNERYGHMLTEGRIEQHSGPVEGEDEEYPEKGRLVLNFDRKSMGRLRRLVDEVNRA